MGRTIIQPIGPLYGEAVNGTVFGRPNGSIYIPQTNQIVLKMGELYVKNMVGGAQDGMIATCASNGTQGPPTKLGFVADSQDNAAYVRIEISDASDFESTNLSYRDWSAGLFNSGGINLIGQMSPFTIDGGTKYYIRAVLMSSTNLPVAVSETYEVTGWVSE